MLIALAACRSHSPSRRAIDPRLAACIPPSAVIVAGADLDRLRASPLYPKLPTSVLATADALRSASYALVASSGKDLLIAARGAFHGTPPAGAKLLAPDLAITGPSDAVQAAEARLRSGAVESDLPSRAEPLAGAHALWIVARGSAALPLSGNAENLNRVLRLTDYTAVAADFPAGLVLQLDAICRTPDRAREFEETLRAFISLTAAGNARHPDVSRALESIVIGRDGNVAHLSLSVSSEAAARLLSGL
ncbi:MAG TPA: hypothetical protein VGF59_34655 [Bryobacteraceae bacterium]